MKRLTATLAAAVLAAAAVAIGAAQNTPESQIVQALGQDRPYHAVPPDQFDQLGWDLPDGGATVKALADAVPGGAFDPRKLETAPAEKLGYRAKWHEVRYKVYGLDWDIPALQLTPNKPLPGVPTLAIINGGSANWYEFFIDPLNRPGLGQYLAQRVPVLLITIPGNYRHGGWTDPKFGQRIPGYLLDRDVSPEEARIRHSVYTFRVVTDGVKRVIETATTGPIVIVGHSTGGEVQFILNDSSSEGSAARALTGLGHRRPRVAQRDAGVPRRAHRGRLPGNLGSESKAGGQLLAGIPWSAESSVGRRQDAR